MSRQFAIRDLTGGYGDTNVIQNLSFETAPGQVIGLFGRNGVGKSTLCRLVQGSLPIRTGAVMVGDVILNDLDPFLRRQAGIGYMAQTGMVFDELTVAENLSLVGARCAPEAYFERFPRLQERLDQQAGSMSGGERKILAFVRAMIENTSIIVLDEPSEGVQPENIAHMQDCILERRAAGATILLAEQNLTMLLSVADRFIGLDSGQVVLDAQKDSISREDLLQVLAI